MFGREKRKTQRKNRNKFCASKMIVDGHLFDSKKEAARYIELKLLEQQGLISDLAMQVRFELLPAQYDENHKLVERKVEYIADFVYMDNGEKVVEDVKGMKTRDYIIKRKLFYNRYHIKIKEV